jgi:hypothetical protein
LDRGPLAGANKQWIDVSESHWAYGAIQEASVDHAFEKKAGGGEQQVASP